MISRSVKHASSSVLVLLLLVGLIIVPLSSLIPPVSAVTILTSKWTRAAAGTNWEGGLVIGDVTGDGVEDVVFAGGGSDIVMVLNGANGNTIATYTNSRISQYCQPQLYDVDGDGVLDILVPLYYLPGLAAVKYTGGATLSLLWSVNLQGSSGSGSVMAKPVAADIDNDGHLDIFLASQDVSPIGSYDGTIVRLNYTGNIVAQNFAWRACSGGLSLGDTDNDGVFEIYQGDRGIYYGDGNYGRGVRSFWADNLTIRWDRLDFLSSSQAPVLADVNGDGVKEVLAGMYGEMNILNSTNGEMIKKWSYNNNNMSVHYGFTVYDIDADGNLELLCNDGDHDNNNYTDVIDLITGRYDAELYLGNYNSTQPYDNKWSPLVANIYENGNNADGSPRMEIITGANTTTLTGANSASLLVFDNNYTLLQNVTGLSGQIGYPFVQDIDGDDNLELVTSSSTGRVYAYEINPSMPAPGYSSALPGSERIRSEVTYFGEARLGVAEHTIMPWEEDYWTAPLVAPVSPGDNSLKIPQSTSSLSFRLRDHQSDSMNYTVTTSPDIGSAIGSSTGNPYNWGVYTLNFNQSLQYDTTYMWRVTASDGTYVTARTYTFRTALAPNAGNSVPTQADPTLIAQDGLGTTSSTFVCTNGTTTDINGDTVTNIYRWSVNGQQVANLILPFNTRNETITKDYSAYSNNGNVIGATWIPNGTVGGAYSFDGKDDAIIISDGGKGYYDNKTYPDNNPELGGGGTWQEMSVEAWIYLTENNQGSRIVSKFPSYEIGFQSGSTNRLIASVYPKLGLIAQDPNNASTDRVQTVSAPSSISLSLNTWYHIALTYESNVSLRLFLNGAMVAQRTGVAGALEGSLGEPIYIGRLVEPFAGMIDEVRIYPHALSATQINNSYLATKDGVSTSSLFCPIDVAAPGALLSCDVIPNDSYGDGFPHSANITLLNTPPVASNLRIYPLRNRDARLDGENLYANYTYFDADGQAETGSQISWFENGVNQTLLYGHLEVPAVSTLIGDQWYFNVTPRDSGGALGSPQVSATVTIRGNIAPSTGLPALDSMNGGVDYDDEDLVATAAPTTDGDIPPDPTTNIFHWMKGGVSQTNLQMPFDTEVPLVLGANGVTNDYSGYGNNGAVNGSAWIQTGVVGGAFNFDGNDFIRVQETGNTLGGSGGWSAISVEFWAKSTSTSTETVLMKHSPDYSTGGSSYGVGYRVDYRSYATGYRVYWYVYNGTAALSVNLQINEGSGQWHHVVCTYQSGTGLKLYTDGTLRASLIATGNINATSSGLLDIGGIGSGSGDYVGQLDEVRIYPTALSAAQIFQRYIETEDGLSSINSIVAQETSAGDSWVCQVIPNDSWGDGTLQSSASLGVVSVVGNSMPRIDWFSPANTTLSVNEGTSLNFTQVSSDPNNDSLSYSWTLDALPKTTTQNWTYSPDFASQGLHTIGVTVSDASLNDFQEWSVNVIDVPNTFYNLTVLPSSNGNTNPASGTYQYSENTNAFVLAIPNLGYTLSHWLVNNTNYGAANPCTVNMTGEFNLTAIFDPLPLYTLHVGVVDSGSTNATGDNSHYEGTNIAVLATADPGWALNHWLLNDTDVGDANPYTLVMNANYNLTAVFAASEYTLTVDIVGSGSVTKNPNQATYTWNTSVTLTAAPADGWVFKNWSGDASGTANPTAVNMTSNKVVRATFVPTYILLIETRDSGTTNPTPGTYTYEQGTNVQVDAQPASGYMLSYWLLDGTNAGAADPYIVTIDQNRNLTAVFAAMPTSVFEDGFESGSTSAWNSTATASSGETVAVSDEQAYDGTYGLKSTSNANGVTEYARAIETFSPTLSQIRVQGYFKLTQNGIVDNSDRIKLIELRAGSTIIAAAGLWQASGTLRWWIETRSGTTYVETYTAQVGSFDLTQWFSLELYWKLGATDGGATLEVNGNQIYQITNADTDNYGNCSALRFGLAELTNCGTTTLYSDYLIVSDI